MSDDRPEFTKVSEVKKAAATVVEIVKLLEQFEDKLQVKILKAANAFRCNQSRKEPVFIFADDLERNREEARKAIERLVETGRACKYPREGSDNEG